MAILMTVLIGLTVGLIARFLKPGNDRMGIVLTTVLGIVGAMLGSYLGQVMGIYRTGEPAGFLGAVIGSIIVLMIVGFFARERSLKI